MSHRTQITLTDEQYERLVDESSRSGLALAELVRRALDQTYGATESAEMLEVLDATFGRWTSEGDGASYVAALRRGMSRRLAEA